MTQDSPHRTAPLGRRQVLIVFGGVMLAMLLGSLDQTVVATALPTIVGDLGGLSHLSWVVTAYVLAATAATPLWGKIGDLYGRKLLFQLAIAVFLAGSVLSGISQNMGELIAFRAFQGLGAGGLFALAWAIIGDVVPPRERGRYQGYLGAMFAVASVAGPLLGGFFAEQLSWRWVFYVNLPIGALALFAVGMGMLGSPRSTGHKIDYPGAALLVAAIISLLLVTTWGGAQYDWGSAQIVGLAALGCGLLGAFVWRERRAPEPIVPLRLFRDPVFCVVTVALLLSTCAFFAVIVFMPLFLQVVTGAGATESGLLLLPLMGGIIVSSTVSGHVITRTGRYKIFPVSGLATMTFGIVLLSLMDVDSSRITASLFMAVFGIGFGLVTQVLTLAIQNAVDKRDLGTATAAANFFRSMGGAVGVAIFGAVFAGRLGGNVDPETLQSSPEKIQSLPPAVHDGVVQAVSQAIGSVFLVAAPIAALDGAHDWGYRREDAATREWKLDSLWRAGAHLMGRVTYQDMAAVWPTSTSAYAAPMNDIPKVVFSKTLETADWAESRIATGDLAEEVDRLKHEPGKDLVAHGGATFAQALSREGLVDEYRLMIQAALGTRLPLFKDLPGSLYLELIEARAFATGAVCHVYHPRRSA